MRRRLDYRVRRRGKYVLTRIEHWVEDDGRQSGSLQVVGEYDSAAEAELAMAALQRGEDPHASEPNGEET